MEVVFVRNQDGEDQEWVHQRDSTRFMFGGEATEDRYGMNVSKVGQ